MLLSYSTTWVNNHPHYLAFTEKIVGSLQPLPLSDRHENQTPELKSDKYFR